MTVKEAAAFRTLSLVDAAALLGVHPDTLRERAAGGVIPGAKIGREWRFIEADLLAYFRAQYKCQSIAAPEAKSGTSIFATAADALDDLLALQTGPKRKGNTTSLRLVRGKSARTAKG